jgi:hypothetical protein
MNPNYQVVFVMMVIGALVGDDVYQRSKRGEAEESLRRLYTIGEKQSSVNQACFSSLSSCRRLADQLSTQGMQSLPARLDAARIPSIHYRPESWKVARLNAMDLK